MPESTSRTDTGDALQIIEYGCGRAHPTAQSRGSLEQVVIWAAGAMPPSRRGVDRSIEPDTHTLDSPSAEIGIVLDGGR